MAHSFAAPYRALHLLRGPLRQSANATEGNSGSVAESTLDKAKRGGTTFLQRCAAFSVGFAAASLAGFVHLQQELEGRNEAVLSALTRLEKEVGAENTRLRLKIEVLEKEMADLKGN